MPRIASIAAWIVTAGATMLGCWFAAAYVFDRFDRGYGRDAWFMLNAYVWLLAAAAGAVGYAALSLFRSPARACAAALAGAAFAVSQLALAYALSRAFPDRDLVVQQLAGAVAIGMLSAAFARPRAA